MSELVVFHKGKRIFNYFLDKNQIQIGRAQDCDLILAGEQVSRHHALIKKQNTTFWLEDQSSLGTFYNRKKISEPVELKDQDRIQILDWELCYQLESLQSLEVESTRKTQIQELTRSMSSENRSSTIEFSEKSQTVTRFFPLLLITDSSDKVSRIIMKKKKIVIGTAKDCQVVLNDSYVSSHHLQIAATDRGFLVQDLDSTNGTWVSGAKIKEMYLKDGEKIKIGKTQILVSLKQDQKEELVPFSEDHFCGMVGKTQNMKYLFSKIQKVAATDMTTLILGETGTGKEMIARAIHDLSERRKKSYVTINCGAMTPQLIESELFGHEKGAFTGAEKQHIGVFEQAQDGTLFLDEIGELPLDLQTKVLRVLEYKTLRRVGGDREIQVDVRIIAATHRNLMNEVKNENFREDLFYRLYVLPLLVSPLRERKDDIPMLIAHFLKLFGKEHFQIDDEAMKVFQKHSWPGNIRELKNTLMRAIAFSENDIIQSKDIEIIRIPSTKTKREVRSVEEEIARIEEALQKTNGDKDEAAKLLGIGRSTLFRKIKQLEIEI